MLLVSDSSGVLRVVRLALAQAAPAITIAARETSPVLRGS
jgi:hypothetical protein